MGIVPFAVSGGVGFNLFALKKKHLFNGLYCCVWFSLFYTLPIPACTWRQNDVVSTSMRRYDVASMLIQRRFVSCACKDCALLWVFISVTDDGFLNEYNHVDPDEMLILVTRRLGLHCLLKSNLLVPIN